jgi:hypothetical protein
MYGTISTGGMVGTFAALAMSARIEATRSAPSSSFSTAGRDEIGSRPDATQTPSLRDALTVSIFPL